MIKNKRPCPGWDEVFLLNSTFLPNNFMKHYLVFEKKN